MDIYELNNNLFTDFVNNSNQKEIIGENIIWYINKLNKKEIIISDIGAGNGIIAKNIISHLNKEKKEFIYNYIEPSNNLINEFLNNLSEKKNVVIKNNNIEEIGIEKSDIIILSFVIHFIPDLHNFLNYIYEKLNKNGYIIIINQSYDNIDNKLKTILGQQINDNTSIILNILYFLKIKYIFEKKNSYFYGYNDIINLNEKGKKYLSLMTLSNFETINETKKLELLEILKNNGVDGKIIRNEDYIIIYKHD